MPIHFMIVPDAQSGSTIRNAFASMGVIDVKVGTFDVLIDLLLEMWLLKPMEQDWRKVLSREALKINEAFWSKSIQNDEKGVVDELDATLSTLLDALRAEDDDLPEINENKNRYARYYNDFRTLHARMGNLFPNKQSKARFWYQNSDLEPIENIVVYIDKSLSFFPWQQDVIKKLQENGIRENFQELYTRSMAATCQSEYEDISHLQESLFVGKSASKKIAIENLQWLVARDVLQEVEVFASMAQTMHKNGTPYERIGVIIPRDDWYMDFLAKTCNTFNIPLSRASQDDEYADIGTQWIFDAIQAQNEFAPPMIFASLLSSALMPYSDDKGQYLASLILDGSLTMNHVEDADDNVKSVVETILSWQKKQSEPNIAMFFEQLNAIAECLASGETMRLHRQRFKAQIEELENYIKIFEDAGFDKLLNQVQPYALKESSERIAWLESIHVVYDDEYLIEDLDHLFLLGFNHPRYPAKRERYGVFSRVHWQELAGLTGLPYDPVDGFLYNNQARLKRQLQCANKDITFLASALSLQGERLAPAGSLADMAFCFYEGEGDLDPESLIIRLEEGKHYPKHMPFVEQGNLQSPRLLESDDLNFRTDLFALRKDEEGNLKPESPSSFETLMISPLAWFLYRRGIEPKTWGIQELDVSTQGTIAHGVFEDCFNSQNSSNDLSSIDAAIEKRMNRHAPFLRQAHRKLERERLRSEIVKAAIEFKSILEHCNAKVLKTEEQLTGTIEGIPVAGRTDALLEIANKKLVLDYKKSGSGKRKTRMEEGYDHQLFLYRLMLEDKNAITAYFTMNDATMIADQKLPCNDKTEISLVEVEKECSVNAEALIKERIRQLREGIIELNSKSDSKTWDGHGVTASYTFDRSPLITLFAKEDEEIQ